MTLHSITAKKTTDIYYFTGNLLEYLFSFKKLPFLPSPLYTASEKVFDDYSQYI